jgi:hypothetical protein
MQAVWLGPASFVTGDPTLRVSYSFVSHPARSSPTRPRGIFEWVSLGLRLPPEAQIEGLVITKARRSEPIIELRQHDRAR